MDTLTIVLIIIDAIIIIAYLIHLYSEHKKKSKNHSDWPPEGVPLPCPDYWTQDKEGNCVNNHFLGTNEKGLGTFADSMLKPSDLDESCTNNPKGKACLKEKCAWANATNNPWFGIQSGCGKTKGAHCSCPY